MAGTQLSDEEYSSLKLAVAIMLLISAALLISTIGGIRFLSIEFETAIVYSPTVFLLIGWIIVSRKRPINYSASA